MLVKEFIGRTQELYSKGVKSKSSRLTNRRIYSASLTGRATVITQASNKGQEVSQFNYQTIECLELIPMPINKLLPKSFSLRSKYRIPKILADIDSLMINSITTIDGATQIDVTSKNGSKYGSGNKYTSTAPDGYFEDGYLFVTNKKTLTALNLRAVYYDPIEAKLYPTLCDCDDCKCDNIMDFDFHLDNRLEDGALKLTYDELVVRGSQAKEDKTNNSSDDNDARANLSYRQTPQQDRDDG